MVDFNLACTVITGSGESVENLLVIRLVKPSSRITEMFCEVAALLLGRMTVFDPSVVKEFVDDLLELFSSIERPSESSIVGLWGELFTILESNDVNLVGASWHPSPRDRFDFSHDDQRIEVKSTRGPRQHHFSSEQLSESGSVMIMIQSLVLADSSTGLTVLDLLGIADQRITNVAVAKHVRRTALKILGSVHMQQDVRLDYETAKIGRKIFRSENVPKPSIPSAGVFNVRFVSDLQLVTPEDENELMKLGGLLAAVV
jgi:hypothetical protein